MLPYGSSQILADSIQATRRVGGLLAILHSHLQCRTTVQVAVYSHHTINPPPPPPPRHPGEDACRPLHTQGSLSDPAIMRNEHRCFTLPTRDSCISRCFMPPATCTDAVTILMCQASSPRQLHYCAGVIMVLYTLSRDRFTRCLVTAALEVMMYSALHVLPLTAAYCPNTCTALFVLPMTAH
jgi:hypothetical protein